MEKNRALTFDQKNNKNFIGFLMDASDVIEKARQEFQTAKENSLILNNEEYESVSDLVMGMQSDVDILIDYLKPYMRFGKHFYAVLDSENK